VAFKEGWLFLVPNVYNHSTVVSSPMMYSS
jgi:hypothetical protein